MPELPEVEVTRSKLAPEWLGRRIARVIVGPPSYFFLTPPQRLVERLRGRTTRDLIRHGKYLFAEFDDASRLLCHLGMTGQMYMCAPERARALIDTDPHVHLALYLEHPRRKEAKKQQRVLMFRDVRKFGKVQWIAPGSQPERLAKLGPDALTIDARTLHAALAHRSVVLKTALLDQSVLAGVGNIYADEALFVAQLSPTRPAHSLDLDDCRELVRALRKVLRAAIRSGGSTINDFLQADGLPGSYQDNHLVYGRGGEPCPRCGRPIARSVLAQRSTHYCAQCQR